VSFGGNDKHRTQWRLERVGGYDRHGNVFSIAQPLTGSVSFPVKTFPNTDALDQFINEFTFFRYGGCCPSWYSVLHESDCFSHEEKYSYTLKGKNYTPEGGKDYVIQLIGSGELVAHRTGGWIQPQDRNHHLPWPKLSTKEEEFLPVEHQPMTLGPHEEPGYEPPLQSPVELETSGDMSEMEAEGVVPNKINMRSPGDLMGVEPASLELMSAIANKRDVVIAKPGSEELRMLDYFGAEASVGGVNNTHILLRENPSKAAVIEEFLHGTQTRLGIADRLGTSGLGSAETHVKDFMIRHQRMLGLSDEDIQILQILRDKGL